MEKLIHYRFSFFPAIEHRGILFPLFYKMTHNNKNKYIFITICKNAIIRCIIVLREFL